MTLDEKFSLPLPVATHKHIFSKYFYFIVFNKILDENSQATVINYTHMILKI
jgi:hypothetical protein